MIGFLGGKISSNIFIELPVEFNADLSKAGSDGYAAIEKFIAAERVEGAGKFAGVKIKRIVAFLEVIEFL